jgi:hypothetical protein
MLLSYKRSQGSIILRVKILDSAATTGAGKTGLAYNSAGLIVSTIADNEASATAYTQAASHVEDISTLGTYAAPSADCCRFKEVDSTNHKGVYEIQLADARFAVASAKSLLVSVLGVTGAAETDCVIPLVDLDPYDGVRAGLTSLPNAAADAAGGLPISDAGALDLDAKLANTNEVTAARMGALTDWIDAGRLDLLLDAIKAKTDGLNFTGNDVKATLDGEEVTPTTASKTGYALTATTGLGNQTANITGNLSGSVGSVAGAVGSVTGSVGSVASYGTLVADIVAAVWAAATSGMTAVGSIGKKLADWTILTSQAVRDALKLAPTAGDPAAGSIDQQLDGVPADTADAVLDEALGAHTGHLAAVPTNPNTVVPDAAGTAAALLSALESHGDSTWATAIGFATVNPDNATITAIHDLIKASGAGDAAAILTAAAKVAALVETSGDHDRFKATALEAAPSGTGGDATIANQTTIINHLVGIKGAGWSTETLKAIDALIDAIKAKTDTLGVASVTATSPVSTAGTLATIVRGDDYLAADGLALEWSSSAWPDLSGASIAMTLRDVEEDAVAVTAAGSVTVAGAGTQTVSVDLQAADTEDLLPGIHSYKFDVQATLAGGSVVTLVRGHVTVYEDQTR